MAYKSLSKTPDVKLLFTFSFILRESQNKAFPVKNENRKSARLQYPLLLSEERESKK